MGCRTVQNRLITEYVDKALSSEENAEVNRHLAACRDCREFFEAVQKSSVAPFTEAGEMQPDNAVWQRIQGKLEMERSRSGSWLGNLVETLAPLLRMPQPVFRLAFVTALIMVVVVLAKWPSSYADPVYGYISEQMTFMDGLKTGDTDLLNGDLRDDARIFEALGE